jgi:hypothetical protein
MVYFCLGVLIKKMEQGDENKQRWNHNGIDISKPFNDWCVFVVVHANRLEG